MSDDEVKDMVFSLEAQGLMETFPDEPGIARLTAKGITTAQILDMNESYEHVDRYFYPSGKAKGIRGRWFAFCVKRRHKKFKKTRQ